VLELFALLFVMAVMALPVLLLCHPLGVYCMRQEASSRLRLHAAVGLVAGEGLGVVAAASMPGRSTGGLEAVGLALPFLLALMVTGGFVGAHAGVGLAECLDPDPVRRSAARRGALHGLGTGAAVGIAVLLIAGVESEYWGMVLAALGAAIGAMVGASRTARRTARQ
jgi:hypothetical protein